MHECLRNCSSASEALPVPLFGLVWFPPALCQHPLFPLLLLLLLLLLQCLNHPTGKSLPAAVPTPVSSAAAAAAAVPNTLH
jgi:hypothetical protein